jgi:hypothetical protein
MTSAGHEHPDPQDAGDAVRAIIKKAGPRQAPAAAIDNAVRAAVHEVWTAEIKHRPRSAGRRWLLAAAVAAVAVAIAWTFVRPPMQSGSTAAGTFIASRGTVRIAAAAARAAVVSGDPLPAGTRIETGAAGAALLSVAAVAMRVGPDTVLDLERPGRVLLQRGRIFVDSGTTAQARANLVIVTALGEVAHVGTRFQVQFDPGRSLAVAVRDGRVRLMTAGAEQILAQAEGATVASSGAITRMTVEPYDAMWAWVSEFVPDFPIDGRPLSAFLDWVARETGRTLTFVGPASRADTERTTLNGSISGLTAMQALDAVLATTRFRYDVTVPGQLRIELQAADDERVRKIATPKSAAEGKP